MATSQIGFYLTNLLIPGDPAHVSIRTASGVWELDQAPHYAKAKAAIEGGQQAGTTYSAVIAVTLGASRAASQDQALDELLPLCLGASYLVGLSVAPHGSTMMSDVSMIPGDYFPRVRGKGAGTAVIADAAQFADLLERFIGKFPSVDPTEKGRLLVHHWLDAIAFWSLEDLVLGISTILEIIAATAGTISKINGQPKKIFVDRINYAASRFNLAQVGTDFRDMRNDLVHEGTLSATKFPGKDKLACGAATSEALHWVDEYIHAAFDLGTPIVRRFPPADLSQVNSFSL